MAEVYYKAIVAGDIKAEVVDLGHTVADKDIAVAICRIHPTCQSRAVNLEADLKGFLHHAQKIIVVGHDKMHHICDPQYQSTSLIARDRM